MELTTAKLLKFLDRTFFPKRCPVCGDVTNDRTICTACDGILVPVSGPQCTVCGRALTNDEKEICDNCSNSFHFFDKVYSCFPYNQVIQKSIAEFKYHNHREYADFYAECLYRHFKKELLRITPNLIVPVPIHADRLRTRGYNQAGLVAHRLSNLSGIPLSEDLLIRTKKTAAQKELGPDMRRKNLAEAFSIDKNSPWFSRYIKSIILVDDIYTTGTTADVCAEVLKNIGINNVYVFCIASVQANV